MSNTFNGFLAAGVGALATLLVVGGYAQGYPQSTISSGSNPIFAYGGTTVGSSTSTLFTVPSGERAIISDVVLTIDGNISSSPCNNRIGIVTTSGTVAEFRITADTYYNDYYLRPTQISHSYRSGLPVNEGESVGVTNHGSCTISYSLSGYFAQP